MNNDDDLKQREQLSAWADGELQDQEWGQALGYATSEQGRASWELYHLVGDVLRSPELAHHARSPLVQRLQAPLAAQAVDRGQLQAAIPAQGAVVAPAERFDESHAANASVFRWKMVAGVASMAAVAAIGWSSLGVLQSGSPAAGAQLAAAPQPPRAAIVAVQSDPSQQAPVQAIAVAGGQDTAPRGPVMIRDQRLDELLAAHRQFGTTSALQMPAGFLRNATFEANR